MVSGYLCGNFPIGYPLYPRRICIETVSPGSARALKDRFFAYQETKTQKKSLRFVMKSGWNIIYKTGRKNEKNNYSTS